MLSFCGWRVRTFAGGAYVVFDACAPSTKLLDAPAILIDNKRARSSAKSTARTLAAN
jgi:hypothetical protein